MLAHECMDLVGKGLDGPTVEARYGPDPEVGQVFVSGKIVGYSDKPQVLILTDDGRRVWWRADMTVLKGKGKR